MCIPIIPLDLSIPSSSANLPDESITPLETAAGTGVYYGYAQIIPAQDTTAQVSADDTQVLPMVMSLGWNPFYKNERMTAVCYFQARQILG